MRTAGGHSSPSAWVRSVVVAAPVTSASAMPASAPVAGAHGLFHASATASTSANAASAGITGGCPGAPTSARW